MNSKKSSRMPQKISYAAEIDPNTRAVNDYNSYDDLVLFLKEENLTESQINTFFLVSIDFV